MNNKAFVLYLGFFVLSSYPVIGHSQSFEQYWQLKMELAVVDPSDSSTMVDVSPLAVDIDFDPKVGVSVRAERRVSERFGWEIGLLGASSFDVTVGGTALGVTTGVDSFAPLSAGITIHTGADNELDLYASPFVAAIRYGGVSTETGIGGLQAESSSRTDFGWGVLLGVDIPFGESRWSLQSTLRYIDTAIEEEVDGVTIENGFDPIVFSLGAAYRFE